MSTPTMPAEDSPKPFLPAAGHDWLLPLYDPLVRLVGGDRARLALLDQAEIRPGQRILDLGCGTGTFVVHLAARHRDVEVVGIDPDPRALARARTKAGHAGVPVRFDRGFADRLPYESGSFARVFSSLMLHHLAAAEKEPALREVARVLEPGGSFHVLDFAAPDAAHVGFLMRLFHASHPPPDPASESLLVLLERAGFARAERTAHRRMFFMPLDVHRAFVPA